ncbi:uncharacterized protein LOC119445491 [Dermacentor silvarum]|uniref:uncharacterized protein LOC119445491 n=1 Tax=Dermacentor silvarum TaxID=543639 RepID=UPI002101D496|nr:uncharacterized protein LOC119445491 [Dermacentor silvarum]
MPPKRQFGKYLWDPSIDVPIRSKYRFRKRSSVGASSTALDKERGSADASEESSRESEADADTGHIAPFPSTASATEDSHILETTSEASSTSSSEDSESEGDADVYPDHGEQHFPRGWKDELDENLFPGSKLTKAESLLMVMAHSLRHGCSKEATESLLQLLSAHLPEGVKYPTSKYTFFRHFAGAEKQYAKHFYCSTCSGYIGELPGNDVVCSHCNINHESGSLLKSSSFFLVMDLKGQIQDVLESGKLQRNSTGTSFDVCDITESFQYNKLPVTANDITLTFNTDGVPLFESSNASMWPLLLMVNELPYKQRVQNLLLAGLWFGTGKPSMNCFLTPFVKTMNELSSTGVVWRDSSGVSHTSKAFPGPCAVDTVARCELTCMTQFNGAYGCAWCEDSGQVVPKGNGFCRVYPPSASANKLRTHESFLYHARKAKAMQAPSCGIKGASVLTLLSFFPFGEGFVVDYMHAVCSGFVRATMFMWLKSSQCRRFHLRKHLAEADECLLSLTPTWELSRLPRSLKDIKEWKAADWRNWLLFYSPVVLKGRIPKRQYNHWLKFVEIMHYLLGPCICVQQLATIKGEIKKFLLEYEELYGVEYMTYNSHLLVHIVDSAINWGPLWGYSLFPFESMNGTLGRYVNGTRYPQFQIANKFGILQALVKLWMSRCVQNIHRTLGSSFKTLMKGYSLRKNVCHVGSVLLIGKGVEKEDRKEFQKMMVGPFTFCTARLDKSKRNNSYAHANNIFGRIIEIFVEHNSSTAASSYEVQVCVEVLRVQSELLTNLSEAKFLHFVEVVPSVEHCIPAIPGGFSRM